MKRKARSSIGSPPQHDIVVRYQGGANAGHTVVMGGQTFKLSLIPSGIFHPEVQCVVAARRGAQPGQPAARRSTASWAAACGSAAQSDDQRPCPRHLPLAFRGRPAAERSGHWQRDHRHHAARHRALLPRQGRPRCMRFGWATCIARASASGSSRSCRRRTPVLRGLSGSADDPRLGRRGDLRAVSELRRAAAALRGRHDRLPARRRRSRQAVALRGAQGALLDIDHGTFPFVTSSNSSGVGVSPGSGVPGTLHHEGRRRPQGLLHAGGRRAVSHRARQRYRPAPPRAWKRIRHGHAAAAALRLVRRGGRPLYRPAERRRCVWRSCSWTCSANWPS